MRYSHTILAAMVLAVAARSATACGYGAPSPAVRFAQAECVLLGKLIAYENRPVKLQMPGVAEPVPLDVAVLRVKTMFKGDERLTHVRVALYRGQAVPPGFEGVFHLNAHPQEAVYLASSDLYDYPAGREGNPNFDKQVEELRRFGRLMKDPEAGLQSKNADDRFLTAALLLTQYRTFNPVLHEKADQTEPIDARTSKLILHALAETDWNRPVADYRLTPWRVFNLLQVKPDDGLNLAGLTNAQQQVQAVRSWLKDNEDKFRVKTFARRRV
jgi:hypothetical protein